MNNMTREEFTGLLDIYSADFSFWPADRIKPALALMERDAECKSLFETALFVDDSLRHADAALMARIEARLGDGAGLAARIMQAIDEAPVPPLPAAVVERPRSWRALFAPGGGLLMVAILGFMMGLQQPALSDDGADGIVGGVDIVIAADGGDLSREVF